MSRRNPSENSPTTPSVPALERGLSIIEVVANSPHGLTLSEIVRKVKLPKSSAHCLLLTFERQGYLHRCGGGHRYVCGAKLARVARSAHEGVVLREKAEPVLRALMRKTGQTIHLATIDADQATLIAKLSPTGAPRLASWIGKRMD